MKRNIDQLKLGVISGGISPERDVCLIEGEEIYKLLNQNNFYVQHIIIEKDLSAAYDQIINAKFDFVFLALTEDIPIQDILDMMHILYTGSSRLATTISMDKVLTKQLIQSLGILTPPYLHTCTRSKLELFTKNAKQMNFPLVVKPGNLGTSIGLSYIDLAQQLAFGIEQCLKYSNYILIEEYIKGLEITIPMMGNNFFGIVEIHPAKNLYDNESKMDNLREQVCPSHLSSEMQQIILRQARHIYELLGCEGLVRIDGIVRENKFYFLEINTLPFMVGTDAPIQVATKLYNMDKLEFLLFIINNKLNYLQRIM